MSQIAVILLKSVGMTILGQLASSLCKDAGESALAYAVQLSAKVGVLAVSLPLLTQLLSLFEEITP